MALCNSEMTDETCLTTGGCLCGAVRHKVSGPLRDVVNCPCSMCQRLHGNFGPFLLRINRLGD